MNSELRLKPSLNFELYLMGLFSPDEVGHDLIQANDLQWINTSEGIFSASSITTTSMEEFIEQNGPRVPNYRDSQKHFDALFVVVSKEPLTLDEWNLYDSNLAEFEATEDDGFKHRYNFWEATYGRASISFNRGDHLLASSLPEKYVLTNVDKKKDLKDNKSVKSDEKKNDTNPKPNEPAKDIEKKNDDINIKSSKPTENKKNDTNVKEDNNGTKN